MKSKTFFSNYAKEHFKKQLWIMWLMTFVLFLVLPVPLMINIGNMEHAQYTMYEMQNDFKMYALGSGLLLCVVMVSGFLIAVYQFRYLHSRKMVDFYHSFPVRKEKFHCMHVVSAYLYFLIPYTGIMMVSIILGLFRGLATWEAIGIYLLVWLLYQVIFLLMYAVAATAMILTGREFVGILGAIVLLYVPAAISVLLDWYQSEFFQTYVGYFKEKDWLINISPGYAPVEVRNTLLSNLRNDKLMSEHLLIMLAIVVVFTVAFFAAGYYLMKKRPSETAGNSMAFSIPARVIHVILSIIGALYIGMFAYGMANYDSIPWLMAGILFGGLVVYILIQFIYTIDFRKVLKYKWQLFLVEMVSIAIASLFCFDWVGFDSYIPEKENLYSVALSIPDGYQYESYFIDNDYVDGEEYRLEHMNLVVTDELYEMLEEIVEKNVNLDRNAPWEGNVCAVPVRYNLKNGKERTREYRVELETYRDTFISLYSQAEFKNVMMPMYGLFTADSKYELSMEYENESIQLFGDDQEKVLEFIQVLKRDFENRKGETFVNEIPIATIWVNAAKMKRSYALSIYPSSTSVISYLADSGYTIESRLTVENILKIDIIDDRIMETDAKENIAEQATVTIEEAGYDVKGIAPMISQTETKTRYMTYTDPEDIEKILPALVNYDYESVWIDTCENLNVTVTYIGKDGYQVQAGFAMLEDKLPDFLVR